VTKPETARTSVAKRAEYIGDEGNALLDL
jgi:hypothetical protein